MLRIPLGSKMSTSRRCGGLTCAKARMKIAFSERFSKIICYTKHNRYISSTLVHILPSKRHMHFDASSEVDECIAKALKKYEVKDGIVERKQRILHIDGDPVIHVEMGSN